MPIPKRDEMGRVRLLTPEERDQSIADRIERYSNPEPMTGCHLWSGYALPNGYGVLNVGRVGGRLQLKLAHRVVYERARGPIPNGLHLDHKCRVIACVNPQHLEPVTAAENVRRAQPFRQPIELKTHCIRGHTLPSLPGIQRACKACKIDLQRKRRAALYHGQAAEADAAAAAAIKE